MSEAGGRQKLETEHKGSLLLCIFAQGCEKPWRTRLFADALFRQELEEKTFPAFDLKDP